MNLFKVRTSTTAQFIKRQAGRVLCSSVESFIFVATTGRSGSKTLYHLCRNIPGCAAFHEPMPEMNADILNAFNNYEDKITLDHFKKFKLPAVYKASLHHKWYIETNHIFIKCFADSADQEFGNRLKIIHLVRDRHEVAKSWLYRGSIPGKGKKGTWLLDPYAPRNIINFDEIISGNSSFYHDYFKCLWYWYEIEARTFKFTQNYPEIPVLSLKTEDLNKKDLLLPIFNKLFQNFDDRYIIDHIGTRVNSSKKEPKPPEDISQSLIDNFDYICQEYLLANGCSIDKTV